MRILDTLGLLDTTNIVVNNLGIESGDRQAGCTTLPVDNWLRIASRINPLRGVDIVLPRYYGRFQLDGEFAIGLTGVCSVMTASRN